jgi:ABC-2 type transport system permease protein
MSWRVVAVKEFRDAIRSLWLWLLTGLFVLFVGGMAGAYGLLLSQAGGEEVTSLGLLVFLLSPASLLVPIIGLVVSYKSIVGERESGSIKFLLGLPHTRLDVVLGKVVGRTAVVVTSVLVGFATAAVIAIGFYNEFSPVPFGLFVLLTVLYALSYISVGVGLSSTVSTTSRALGAAVGFFVIFEMFWGTLVGLFSYGVDTLLGQTAGPAVLYLSTPPSDWAGLLASLPPGTAFSRGVSAVLPGGGAMNSGGVQVNASQAQQAAGAVDPAFYQEGWFGVTVLFLWVVVPLTRGYLRFRDTDL